eukprot:scaffold20722_cov33-Tisochrysis_lutea.AAC.2
MTAHGCREPFLQREMNAILSPKADIYVAFRLQLVAKLVVITLIYSSALPVAYLLTAAFMWLAMWIDRFNLLRRFSPPPRSPDFLIGVVLAYILPAAIAIHLASTILFYEQERALMHSDPLCSTLLGQAFASATGTVHPAAHLLSAGELTGPASADSFDGESKFGNEAESVTHTVRCQTAATIAQADAAAATAWVAAIVWGLALLVYCVREATRVHDSAIHLTSQNIIAKFADVFSIQQPVSRQVSGQGRERRAFPSDLHPQQRSSFIIPLRRRFSLRPTPIPSVATTTRLSTCHPFLGGSSQNSDRMSRLHRTHRPRFDAHAHGAPKLRQFRKCRARGEPN